jgi:membrane-associated phospholipid phosphatase
MVNGDKNVRAQGVPLLLFSKKQLYRFFSVFLLTWGVSLWLWHQVAVDRFVLLKMNNQHFSSVTVDLSLWLSQYGMSAICLIYFIYLSLCHKKETWRDKRPVFLVIIFAFVMATISTELLKWLFSRPRPIYAFPDQIVDLSRAASYSFPSGHSSKGVALALPFILFGEFRGRGHSWIKGLLALLAVGICSSRLVLGAHYLSDVLAGAGWAVLCLLPAQRLAIAVLQRMTAADYDKAGRRWLLVYLGLIVFLSLA